MKDSGKAYVRLMVVLSILLLSVSIVYATVPERINYQGYLSDKNGNPITTAVTITVRIYTVPSGGTPLWTEQHVVVPDEGIYNIVLGSMEPLYLDYYLHDLFYLGVQIGTDAEMTPRQEVTSVGSAHTADRALNLNCIGCVSQSELDFTPGDITGVNTPANSGLTGGSTSGDVTLSVNFAGSGTTNTVARSDHNHDATYVNAGESNSVTSAMIQDGAIMNTDINASAAIAGSKLASDGSVMKSLIEGSNVSVTNNNNGSWTVNSTGGGSGWSITGNTDTIPGTNFIGTTDNKALEVKVNNTRALRIEPNATSPNMIAGYSGNTVLSGALGATISGGGESGNVNTITDNFGTIGGGTENISGSNDGFGTNSLWTTVGGGNANTASGGISTIGGGQINTASGLAATVAGGYSNLANAGSATVGGGSINTVNGDYSTIGGGLQNFANAKYATISGGGLADLADISSRNRVTDNYGTIGGGGNNQAGNNVGTNDDATFATVSGGSGNIASGPAATVGGGGGNTASGLTATLAGGRENTASGDYTAVGGGGSNIASGYFSTVGGGSSNTAMGEKSTTSGGESNIASNLYSTVGGGASNTSSGPGSTVGGGASNLATGEASTVGGGNSNTASHYYSTATGGVGNLATGYASAVGGGVQNTTSGLLSTVPGGSEASAEQYGQMAYAGGCFVESPQCRGKAQASLYVLRNITTDGNVKELFLNGEFQTERINVGWNRTMTFEILVTARSSTGDSGGFKIWGTIENYFGTTSFVSANGEVWGSDDLSWGAWASADNGNDALIVTVQGATGKTVRWVAVVHTAEVAF